MSEYSRSKKLEHKLSQIEKRDRFLEKDRSEDVAVYEEVFDKTTLTLIHRLINKGIIGKVYGVINSGKESRIFYGVDPTGQEQAIKIYLTTSKEFRRGMLPYIQGDPRFKLRRRGTRSLIYAWAQKEYKNLQRASAAGIRVPRPFHVEKNILIMEFIGDQGDAAPTLKEKPPATPQRMYDQLIEYMKLLFMQARLVHGDLSEYNIMNVEEEPIIFDLSQAVSIEHPQSREFLHRDIRNINHFFKKLNVDIIEEKELYKKVVGENGERDPH